MKKKNVQNLKCGYNWLWSKEQSDEVNGMKVKVLL